MAKTSRNDPCPCGSGKKYKKCCLPQEQASAPPHAPDLEEAIMQARAEAEALDDLSNSVVDLIEAGKLDEAEKAGRRLLDRYPDEVDGLERLAMVYEAQGQNKKAAEHYRKAVDFMRKRPGFDKETIKRTLKAAARLESALKK